MPDERPVPDPADAARLQSELERVKAELERAKAEAAGYRRAAYQLLDRLEPYTPPTEAELQELLHGPRGASFADVLDEYDRRHGG